MYEIIPNALTVNLSLERVATFGKMAWFNEPIKEYQKQILYHAQKYYDLSTMVGFEEWGHVAGLTQLPDIHQDKDEKLATTGIIKTAMCSCIYYHKIKDLIGADLVLYEEDDSNKIICKIKPQENMLVLLSPGVWHGVSRYISGTRSTVNINPWDYPMRKNNS